jgi:hypothetical protein
MVKINEIEKRRKKFKKPLERGIIQILKRITELKGIIPFQKRSKTLSQNYIRLDELKRHLRIYILKNQGMEVPKILSTDKNYKERIEKNELVDKRLVYMDIAKAKRIIGNVEHGIFPGKY